MPAIADVELAGRFVAPTPVQYAMTPQESAWNSLHGKTALTPIIAGSVSGGFVITGWMLGLILYINRRCRRRRRAKKVRLGLVAPKEKEPLNEPRVVIPPDPAVLSGLKQPGEFAWAEDDPRINHPAFGHFRQKSSHLPPAHETAEEAERGEGSREDGGDDGGLNSKPSTEEAHIGDTDFGPALGKEISLPRKLTPRTRSDH